MMEQESKREGCDAESQGVVACAGSGRLRINLEMAFVPGLRHTADTRHHARVPHQLRAPREAKGFPRWTRVRACRAELTVPTNKLRVPPSDSCAKRPHIPLAPMNALTVSFSLHNLKPHTGSRSTNARCRKIRQDWTMRQREAGNHDIEQKKAMR